MARAYYCDRRKVDVEPVCLQSKAFPWMRASLDGVNFEKEVVVEIKCGESVYKQTSRRGVPPEYYYAQLQHILAVTGLKTIDFWCYLPDRRPLLKEVRRNQSYIDGLIATEEKFWLFVESTVMKRMAEI